MAVASKATLPSPVTAGGREIHTYSSQCHIGLHCLNLSESALRTAWRSRNGQVRHTVAGSVLSVMDS